MKDINLLHPDLKPLALKLVSQCKANGIDIIITQTLRTKTEQDGLYAQGRTAPGNIVTNAKYPWSLHCWGVAFDFVPVVAGKAVWNDMSLFDRVGRIGEALGLEWGGRWTSIVDRPHFQLRGFKWLELQNKYGTPEKYRATWEDEEVEKIKVVVNGKNVEGLLTKDGVSYIPARVVSESLGAAVTWDGATKTVTIKGRA